MPDPSHPLRRKLLVRLVAPLTFLTFLSSLDRVNVSFAALQMNSALGLSPERYGFGVGLFFSGYLLFQFPHTALLRRIGARRWILAAVLSWGAVATAMAGVQSAAQFYTLRVLLGVAEAGFAPGIVYYMSQWMPQRFRASAIAGSMLAIPISIVLGGPLSGWLMSLDLRMPGWRFMFLVEGALTIVIALLTPLYFVDVPEQARWLTDEEKRWLAVERSSDARTPAHAMAPTSLRGLLASSRVWAAALVWFSLMTGAYGIIFWLPQVIKQLSDRSDLKISLLSALPWMGLGAGMLVNAWHSDRTQERYLHIAGPALLAALGLGAGASLAPGWLALLCLVVGAFGLGGAQGAFWALPTSFLERSVAASGITMINLLGSAGGLIGPPAIGWVRRLTGSFVLPIYALALLLVFGALVVLALRRFWPEPARPPRPSQATRLSELPR
jgi:ACS family tartrate transporter-like MFS transporter